VKHVSFLAILLLAAAPLSAQCLLTYQTEAINAFTVGEPANFQIEAVSGTEPYHFNIYEGELPAGLHLTGSGKIVGVPKAEGESVVLVTVTDAAGCSLTQAFIVVVNP